MNTNMSRRAQRQSGKPKKEKSRNLLLPTLFFIFILIPVAILIFVAFVYEPDDTDFAATNDNEVSFETTPSEETPVLVPEETEEEVTEEAEPEEVEKVEEAEEPAEQPAEDTPKEETPAETEQPVENTTPAPQETPAAATPAPPANNDPVSSKSVVVKPNETLYRIAVNNYGASGAGAAVEKIKQANGLSSNEIFVGQTLILP